MAARIFVVTYQDKDFSISRKEFPVATDEDFRPKRIAARKFWHDCRANPEVSQAHIYLYINDKETLLEKWARDE